MRTILGRLAASLMLAICVWGFVAGRGAADPFSAGTTVARGNGQATLVEKVHGFHCRPVLGWDPVAGLYHVHRHEGICRNYQRCLREHQRCIFVLGGGFEPWTYERFGRDNYRYYGCMIRAGCY